MAGLQFNVRGDLREIDRAVKQYGRLATAAAVSSINRAAALARTQSVKKVSAAKKLPTRIVGGRAKLKRANFRKQAATLTALTAGVPVDKLKARVTEKKGVFAAGRKFPHAFQAKGLIFERKVVGGNRVGRLPIERVKIPLQPQMSQIFGREVEVVISRRLRELFKRDLDYRLSKVK